MTDVPAINRIINDEAGLGLMLFRSMAELYEHIRDFVVYELDGKVSGCCALHIVWHDLAEVKSLAVAMPARGRGVGSQMVQATLNEAARIGLKRVFALTYQERFFRRLGFDVVHKDTLPHKVWTDCVKCPKQHACDEIAVVRPISPEDLLLPAAISSHALPEQSSALLTALTSAANRPLANFGSGIPMSLTPTGADQTASSFA